MIKVGTKKTENPKIKWVYTDVKTDKDGWADSSQFLPADYDLCFLRTKNQSKTISGWHCPASGWEGFRLEEDDPVMYWKKNKDVERK